MTKQDILNRFKDINYVYNSCMTHQILSDMLDKLLENRPEIVRCKDCIHRGRYDERLHCVVYPDEKCPALCDDPFYSWRPDDDWFCPNGETME